MINQDFPRSLRLLTSRQFQQVFHRPKKSVLNGLTFFIKPNNLNYSRLGLAISKKNIPLAVGRNRVKRLIRESFRRNQDRIKGLDIVVITQRSIGSRNNTEIFKCLEKQWSIL